MSKRYPGGLITKTPVTPTTSSAPGVWTLEQALQYIKAGTWPLYVLSDPYFPYVTMLLHGDGTNGAQNNTFLDSSTNNFTITRNGNTTQGSFSPYGSNWSNYFAGSGNYFTMADSTAFNLSGGSYTIECWIYPSGDYGNYNTIVAKRAPSSGSTAWEVYLRTGSGVLSFYNGTNCESAVTPTANVWSHVAAVYDGTNINLYLNGTRVLQSAIANNNIAASVYIATYPSYDERYIGGISNLRITKGAALYSGTSFTVPTTPLTTTVSSGTVSLLTCQSNRFVDTSVNAAAITVTGTPSVQRFSPFSPSAAYSTSTIGGSGYFDGSGDYLALASNSAFDLGSGDFTIEFWMNTNASQTSDARVIGNWNNDGWAANKWSVHINHSSPSTPNQVAFWVYNANSSSQLLLSTTTVNGIGWVHVAIVRSGTSWALFINGSRQATATSSAAMSSGACPIQIGGTSSAVEPVTGYITDVRMVKGTAVYSPASTTITVPTAPLTAITNTSLLTNFTNGGIFDNAMMNNLETVGNAQISTSVVKFGTGSMAFNGTNSYLAVPLTTNLQFGTGDFTVECWTNITSKITQYPFVWSNYNNFIAGTIALLADHNSAPNKYSLAINGVYPAITSTTSVAYSSWVHLAAVRSSGVITLYVNGIANGTYSTSAALNGVGPSFCVGASLDVLANSYINGYIDDLRITKGYARYTANFTPPTAAFPNQ